MSQRSSMIPWMAGVVCGMALVSGCADDDGENSVRDDGLPQSWTVMVPDVADEGTAAASADLVKYLGEMGLDAVETSTGEAGCRSGAGVISFVTQSAYEQDDFGQTFSINETRCGSGRLVELDGSGQLGRQYAAYEFLHALGVRFFHPEEEWFPESPMWPEEVFDLEVTPDFEWRSVSLHLTHPLELGDAFRTPDAGYVDEGVRYIEWQLKNGASFGTGGIGDGAYARRGLDRGFPSSNGFALHNQQQGGGGIIDPDDERSNNEQIAAAIDARMGDDPENYPDLFSFTFNPSEVTELPDNQIVDELTFIANYFAENYPGTLLQCINHGTAGEPTENYGVRFYDLPQFAPTNLGVSVHTLMFYDLFRPAPVYGNVNFNNMFDFMEQEYQERRLWYYPESAWWLTFDIPVPLYLPITLEARDRDIQGIKFMLEGKLDGHRVFGSGHEWGYWQNEYCSFRMAMDTDYRYTDCIDDIVISMGDAAPTVRDAMLDTIEYQTRDIVNGALIRYLVGTDQETEAADSIGINFHPLPPAPQQIMNWSLGEVEAWREDVEPALKRMDDDYSALVDGLNAVEDEVPESGGSWFREIRDGIEVTGLRARHAWQVYGALVSLRESQLAGDSELAADAESLLSDARQTTNDATTVIRRREQDYRYSPLDRAIAGGPEGGEDENWTGYAYRYLNRTHHAFYWTRIDDLASAAFEGGDRFAEVSDTLLAPSDETTITVVQADATDVQITFGDGTSADASPASHSYSSTGRYSAQARGEIEGEAQLFTAEIAVVEQETITGRTGEITEPSGASLINSVIPGLVYGELPNGTLALGFTAGDGGVIKQGNWSELGIVEGDTLETVPQDIIVPIFDGGSGEIFASLTVFDAVLIEGEDEATVTVSGLLGTEAVINAVVTVSNGAFDAEGAREIVASILGYTVDTLPERDNFVLQFQVSE